MMLHSDLHTDFRSGRMLGPEMRQRHVALEQRRPAAARRVPELLVPAAIVDGHARAPRLARQPRRQAYVGVQLLQRIPVDRQTRELPRRAALAFGVERRLAVVALLVGRNGP